MDLVRLRDDQHGGRPRILKLKDWPTKKDFASVFPTLLHDLMNNIPFSKLQLEVSGKSEHIFLFQVIIPNDRMSTKVLPMRVER